MSCLNFNLIRIITPRGAISYYVCANEDLANLSPYASVYRRNCTSEELWGVNGFITQQQNLARRLNSGTSIVHSICDME